jgi:phosphate-selective porin OprO/OprP
MISRQHVIGAVSLAALLASPAARAEENSQTVASAGAPGLTSAGLTSPATLPASVVAAQLVALQTELAEVDQRARAAEARAAVAEQKVTAAASPPVAGFGDKGFLLRSPDGGFALKIKGLVAFDGRAYGGDPSLSASDGFVVRKLRPIFEATVLEWADVRFMPDFAGSKAVVVDAFIDVRPAPWFRLRAGKLIAPVGLERNQQDSELALVERSLTANLSQVRDIGVVAYLDPWAGLVHLEVGVVNGGPDNANLDNDTNEGKDAVGRLLVQPFKLPALGHLGALAVGISGSTGVHRGSPSAANSGLGTFVTPGQNTYFSYLASATDPTAVAYADGLHRRLDPQAFYYVGPFGILAEYALSQQRVTRNGTSARLTHRAWHSTASFVIGGKPSLNGVSVTDRFAPSEGHFGALELAARFGQFTLDDATFPIFADATKSARKAQELAAGASLYFNRNFKVSLDYDQTTFEAFGAAAARPDERLFIGRTQFLF